MTQVTVLAARRDVLVGVHDILRDWAALGVVDEVFTIAMEDLAGLTLPATRLRRGEGTRVLLADELSISHDIDLLRIGVLDLPQTAPQISLAEAGRLREAVHAVLPTLTPVCVHLIAVQHLERQSSPSATAVVEGWDVEAGTWHGWHNVLVVPENSSAPGAGVSPVVAGVGNPVALTHAVAATAGLLGLYSGHRDSPFDTQGQAGRWVRLARTFARFLTSDALDHELLVRVADVRDHYPVPRHEGAQLVVVDDETEAAVLQAQRLLDKHREVLPRPRVMPTPTPATPLGAMEALRMLFVFLGAALRNAPRAFLDSMMRRTSARIARHVGGFVFGHGDSAFTVVVNGVAADGRPADAAAMDAALDSLAERAAGTGHIPNLPENLSALWHDFVAGGMTLFDGGTRVPELPPLTVGAARAVVSTTGRVVPAAGDGFQPGLDGALEGWWVGPGDFVRGYQLDRRLQQLSRDQPHLSDAAARERRALADWMTRQDGYTGRVGRVLADAIAGTVHEIAMINDRLRQVEQAADVPADVAQGQSSLARRLLTHAGISLVLLLVVVLLTTPGPLTWPWGVGIGVLIVVVWLISSTVVFQRHQRALFAMLHQREEDARLSTVLRQHLTEAIVDARRLNRAYRQYLDWIRAFGTFAHAPLGQVTTRPVRELLVGPGLPNNVRIGVARAEPGVVADAVDTLRRAMFGVGWLQSAWEDFCTDLPAGLGDWQYELRMQPEILWSDPRIDVTGSVLTAWSAAVATHSPGRAVPSAVSRGVTRLLDDNHLGVADRLRQQVRVRRPDTGDEDVLGYPQFVAGLDAVTTAGVFQSGVLATGATPTLNADRVADTYREQARSGLNLSLVVTQVSAGLMPEDLRTNAVYQDGSPEDDTPLNLPPV